MMEVPSYEGSLSTFGKQVKVSHTTIDASDRLKQISRLAAKWSIGPRAPWLQKLEQIVYLKSTIGTKYEPLARTLDAVTWRIQGLESVYDTITFDPSKVMTALEDIFCEALARSAVDEVRVEGFPLKLFLYMPWLEWDSFIFDRKADDFLRLVSSRPSSLSMPSVSTFNPTTMTTRPVPRFNNHKYLATLASKEKHDPKIYMESVLRGVVLMVEPKAPVEPPPVPTGPTGPTAPTVASILDLSAAASGPSGPSAPVTKGIFKCPKCKSFDVDAVQVQTRSADEAMTNMCTCRVCKHKFRRG